jgi:ADP-L-glycero-D-manno-heptose 6-epimerase
MVIVTGGAGFIGSALIAALNSRGVSDILVVDELGRDERWKNLRNLSFADYLEKNDFSSLVVQDKLPPRIEAVFHLGACTDTTETDASFLIKNNYEYSKHLARWSAEKKVRFIYASSAATYGDGSAGFSDNEKDLEKLRPLNMYGYSKHLFDLWAKRTGLLSKIAGLKYFNVFGPNEYHKGQMRSFVLKAFEQIKDRGQVGLFKSYRSDYADGEQKRDFLYVKDAVEMTLFFLDRPEVSGIFNIGSGQARSWNDLAKAVFAAMGKSPKIEYIDMPEAIRDKYQYYTCADMTKLRKAGYRKAITSLEDSVEDYVRNYLTPDKYLSAAQ